MLCYKGFVYISMTSLIFIIPYLGLKLLAFLTYQRIQHMCGPINAHIVLICISKKTESLSFSSTTVPVRIPLTPNKVTNRLARVWPVVIFPANTTTTAGPFLSCILSFNCPTPPADTACFVCSILAVSILSICIPEKISEKVHLFLSENLDQMCISLFTNLAGF